MHASVEERPTQRAGWADPVHAASARRAAYGTHGQGRASRATILHASAKELLASFSDRSIDVLITDPPYSSIDRSSTCGAHLRSWFRGSMGWPEIGRILRLARSRLRPTGIALVMTNQAGLESALHAMRAAGFIEPVRVITWDRRWPGLGGGLRHRTEYVLVGRLPGSRPLAGDDLVSVAAVGPGTAGRWPTQKPDGLGRTLARMAGIGRGDVVVDPFCGSGALLVGAAERGATVIGSDISARAIRLATKRLTAAAPARPPTSLEGPRRPGGTGASRKSARGSAPPSRRRAR